MDCRAADGIVVVVVLLVILLMSALVAAVTSMTASELLIAANFRHSREASYAATAAAERALSELSTSDWASVLAGNTRSTFADGAPGGIRSLPNGDRIDLMRLLNLANCRKPTSCSDDEMNLVTAERPRGANNPRWQLFGYGSLAAANPAVVTDSPFYVVVMVADDASETDDNPLLDATPGDPGAGILALRAEAFGPRSTHKTVELTAGRTASGRVGVLSWRELR
jgi:hypothetical protein